MEQPNISNYPNSFDDDFLRQITCKQDLHKTTSYKRLLIYHQTGTGKTCGSLPFMYARPMTLQEILEEAGEVYSLKELFDYN